MVTVARVITTIVGIAFFAMGFAVVVLREYRLVSWPYRRSISRRKALRLGAANLVLGLVLVSDSFTYRPFMVVVMAFVTLVTLACVALVWYTDIKHGYVEQDSLGPGANQQPPGPS